MIVNIIVQARMSSTRFPGKVMADLDGKPMIGHLVDSLKKVKGAKDIIFAASKADVGGDLHAYLLDQNVQPMFGPEDDVAARFLAALDEHSCDAFVRVCADSPFIDPNMINCLIRITDPRLTIFREQRGAEAFGCAQICSTAAFRSAYPLFDDEEREHVLLFFQRLFRGTVDTPQDLARLRWYLDFTKGER